MKKLLLILNPISGNRKGKKHLPWMIDFFEQHGYLVDVYQTEKSLDALYRAKKARNRYDLVVAAGGDGTINEVLNGLANTKTKLGVVPLGTENVLAQEFKLSQNVRQACKHIISGSVKQVDLGKVTATPTVYDQARMPSQKTKIKPSTITRYFILMSGIGFDAHVAHVVAEKKMILKKLLGSASYHLTAVQEFFRYTHQPLEITLSDPSQEKQEQRVQEQLVQQGSFVVVGNAKYYSGMLQLTHKADMQDGYLDVLLLKKMNLFNVFQCLLGGTIKNHNLFDDISYFKTKKLAIKTLGKQPVLIHVDCEITGQTPATIEVCPRALHLIC